MHVNVLIVDDEPELAEYTAKYFNMSGVSAEYVLDAESARRFLQENTCSLILLDINLGEDSGFDLCREIRNSLDIPIFFISARSSEDDMLLALGLGGDDYICKPYSLSVLLAKVKAALKRYEAVREHADSADPAHGSVVKKTPEKDDSVVTLGSARIEAGGSGGCFRGVAWFGRDRSTACGGPEGRSGKTAEGYGIPDTGVYAEEPEPDHQQG